MKISNVEIRNFGILHNIDIDFQADKKNIVFLNASNGGGKTTFQSALAWCIYGIKPEEDRFLSSYELRKLKIGEIVKVSIKIVLDPDQDGRISIIERAQNFEKINNSEAKLIGNETLNILQRDRGPGALTEPHPAPATWLKKFFPPRLQGFFLFDGEQMTKFWEQNVKLDIESAVKEIARVDLFDSIRKKMKELEQSKFKKISKKGGGKAELLEQQREEEVKLLEIEEGERKQTKESLDQLREGFKNLSRFMGETQNHKDDARELKNLEGEELRLRSEIDRIKREIDVLVFSSGILASLAITTPELFVQVEKAQHEDWLPPPFEPERVRSLLQNKECICGNAIHSGSSEEKKLHTLIERFQIASVAGKELDETHKQMLTIINSLKSDSRLTTEKTNHVKSLMDSQRSVRDKQTEILERLKGINANEVDVIARNYEETHRKILDLEITETSLRESINKRVARIEDLDSSIKSATKNDKEAIQLSREVEVCKEIALAAEKIYESAIEQVRSKLERAVSQNFDKVKLGGFQTVITDDFEVLTLKDGRKTSLSEGEKMLKGYIFSIALRDVINLNLPLVVDTPFGRLGAGFRKMVAEELASLMSGGEDKHNRQLIFSMHDLEYTPLERRYFEKANPKELYLANDPESPTEKSILGEGIDPSWYLEGHWREFANAKKTKQ
jgi:DNA sulfur modification protein DndD